MNENQVDIPKAMKILRLKKDMTQGDVFRTTGLERAYVSKLEAGKIYPSIKTITKIAKAFGMKTWEFIKIAEEE